MTTWAIKIPFRDRSEPLADVACAASMCPDREDRLVLRELVLGGDPRRRDPPPRSWIPRRRPRSSTSHPEPASLARGASSAPNTPRQKATRAFGVVGGELDQRGRHGPSMPPSSVRVAARRAPGSRTPRSRPSR
jgi:hypothetical protein